MTTIQNIIFDFGGVILNVDYQKIINAFKSLGIPNFDTVFSQAAQSDLMDRLETGSVSPEDFRTEIRHLAQKDISNQRIDDALNAILLDLPKHRIELLQHVKRHYRIFLFSNTNQINFDYYYPLFKRQFGFDIFDELFEKAYLSHEIGMRKPEAASFQYIISEQHIDPDETLFIDDSIQHVEGARKAGLYGFWLKKGMDIADIFNSKYFLKSSVIHEI